MSHKKGEKRHSRGMSRGNVVSIDDATMKNIKTAARKILDGSNNVRPIFKMRQVMHSTHATHG
jgi:hypothetical protein